MRSLTLKNTGIKVFLTAAIAVFLSFTASAQRFAFVDVNKILESIPEYQEAQAELDRIAKTWRQEIAQEYDVIKGMYNRYQAEQVLMSDEARAEQENAIMEKEKAVRKMQKERFGPEGDLFKRRQELVRPIQDRVYDAIEEYANERGYDFIFDKSGAAGIIFSNEEYNKTDDILKKLK